MIYLLVTGAVVAGWLTLAVMAGERQRRMNELEIGRQINEAAFARQLLPPKKHDHLKPV